METLSGITPENLNDQALGMRNLAWTYYDFMDCGAAGDDASDGAASSAQVRGSKYSNYPRDMVLPQKFRGQMCKFLEHGQLVFRHKDTLFTHGQPILYRNDDKVKPIVEGPDGKSDPKKAAQFDKIAQKVETLIGRVPIRLSEIPEEILKKYNPGYAHLMSKLSGDENSINYLIKHFMEQPMDLTLDTWISKVNKFATDEMRAYVEQTKKNYADFAKEDLPPVPSSQKNRHDPWLSWYNKRKGVSLWLGACANNPYFSFWYPADKNLSLYYGKGVEAEPFPQYTEEKKDEPMWKLLQDINTITHGHKPVGLSPAVWKVSRTIDGEKRDLTVLQADTSVIGGGHTPRPDCMTRITIKSPKNDVTTVRLTGKIDAKPDVWGPFADGEKRKLTVKTIKPARPFDPDGTLGGNNLALADPAAADGRMKGEARFYDFFIDESHNMCKNLQNEAEVEPAERWYCYDSVDLYQILLTRRGCRSFSAFFFVTLIRVYSISISISISIYEYAAVGLWSRKMKT